MVYIIVIYLIFEALFDKFAILGTTYADVSYNVMNYSFVAAIVINQSLRGTPYKWFFRLTGVLFSYYALNHLVCWNLEYGEYRSQIENEGSVPVYAFLLMAVFLISYLIDQKPWAKHSYFT